MIVPRFPVALPGLIATFENMPRYPVTTVLLGRLAVDRSAQRAGLGEFLLMDAMYRTLLATQVIVTLIAHPPLMG